MKEDLQAQLSLPGTHGLHGGMKKVVIHQMAGKDVRSEGEGGPSIALCPEALQ
jgi:hypothetical protein